MNHVTRYLSSANISTFSSEIENFAISWNTDIDCILVHRFLNLLIFFDSLGVFHKHGYNLMMLAKSSTLGLVKVKIFQYKGYNGLIVDYDVTNKIYVTQIIF